MSEEATSEKVIIPPSLLERLKGLGPHFCLVEAKGKSPAVGGKRWQQPENLMMADDPRLQEHLERGGNYGIVGSFELVILDADTEEIKQLIEEKLPDTFTVESPGSKGWHCYYLCSLEKSIRLRDKDRKNLGDIQGQNKMCVGPGSIHSKGGRYKVVKYLPFAQINADQLRDALKEYIIPEKEFREVEQSARDEKTFTDIDIRITEVVPVSGLRFDGEEYYGAHPIHGSETGQNFWVNPSKNVWHCFRHSTGGGPLLWLAVEEGIIDCAEATGGALKGSIFKDVLEKAIVRGWITKERVKKVVKHRVESFYGLTFGINDRKRTTFVTLTRDVRLGISRYSHNKLAFEVYFKSDKEYELIQKKILKSGELNTLTSIKTKFFKEIIEFTTADPEVLQHALRNVTKAFLNHPDKLLCFKKVKDENESKLLTNKHYTISDVLAIVDGKYPTLSHVIEEVLSVIVTVYIWGIKSPAWADFVAPSSFGKSVAFGVLRGFSDVKFVDDFTRSSFVSGFRGQDSEGADLFDDPSMLKELNGKILVVSDLSPLLTLPREKVAPIFGLLTRLYDGEGFTRWLGTVGELKYEDIHFSMVAGATPTYERHWTTFEQLGSRKMLIRPNRLSKAEKEKRKNARTEHRGQLQQIDSELKQVIHSFLYKIKVKSPIRWNYDEDDGSSLEVLNALAEILSRLRSGVFEVSSEWTEEIQEIGTTSQGEPIERLRRFKVVEKGVNIEIADRAFVQLYDLARGHAILYERNYITMTDVQFVSHFAFQSCKHTRSKIFKAVLRFLKGKMVVFSEGFFRSDICQASSFSYNTVKLHLEELRMLEMVSMYEGLEYEYKITDERILDALKVLDANGLLSTETLS